MRYRIGPETGMAFGTRDAGLQSVRAFMVRLFARTALYERGI